MTTERIQTGIQGRAASFVPSSMNDEERTIDVVWSTGARVERSTYGGFSFIEELEMTRDAVRLERMNNGAPVLNTHSSYSLSDIIGAVVDGSARVEDGKGVATLKMASGTAESDDIWRKITDGIIRNISVGYRTHKFERSKEGDKTVMRAVDWEPHEVSFVPIPADAQSSTRSESGEFETLIEDKESEMTEEEIRALKDEEATRVRGEALEILDAYEVSGLDLSGARAAIKDGKSIDEVRKDVIDERAKEGRETAQRSASDEELEAKPEQAKPGSLKARMEAQLAGNNF